MEGVWQLTLSEEASRYINESNYFKSQRGVPVRPGALYFEFIGLYMDSIEQLYRRCNVSPQKSYTILSV